jgi:hypothetical protein
MHFMETELSLPWPQETDTRSPIICYVKAVHVITSCAVKICLNIIPTPTPKFYKWSYLYRNLV